MGAIGSTSSATLSSILLTTVPTVPEEEVSESGRTVQTDWIIGILMMIFSLACAIAYYVILVVG